MADWAEKHDIQLDFIKPGKPTQNSYVERFNRTYRTEVLSMYALKRLSEVREITDSWIRGYNEQRPHDSLGDLTPREFLIAAQSRKTLKVSDPNLRSFTAGSMIYMSTTRKSSERWNGGIKSCSLLSIKPNGRQKKWTTMKHQAKSQNLKNLASMKFLRSTKNMDRSLVVTVRNRSLTTNQCGTQNTATNFSATCYAPT